jgi:hypothetical protein
VVLDVGGCVEWTFESPLAVFPSCPARRVHLPGVVRVRRSDS